MVDDAKDCARGSSINMVLGAGKSNCHSPGGEQVPLNTTLLSYRMVTVVVVKVTSHPASHNVPMDTNKCDLRSGTMCAVRAAIGSMGTGSSAVCVDVMVDPFGFLMVMGFLAILLLWMGKLTVRKLSVLPVSAIAI
jgi:hypothetical protein